MSCPVICVYFRASSGCLKLHILQAYPTVHTIQFSLTRSLVQRLVVPAFEKDYTLLVKEKLVN